MHGYHAWSFGIGDRTAFQSRLSQPRIRQRRWLYICLACSTRYGCDYAGTSCSTSDASWKVRILFSFKINYLFKYGTIYFKQKKFNIYTLLGHVINYNRQTNVKIIQ